MNDSRIIELFFNRSEQAIAQLSAKYERLIIHVANNLLNNSEDAKEIANDTYITIAVFV